MITGEELVFVMLIALSRAEDASQDLLAEPSINSPPSTNGFQLRVITPYLAHCHEDIYTIPLLENGQVFPLVLMLRDLRASVAKSIDIVLAADNPSPQECNCKIAEMIYDAAHPSADGVSKVVVVSTFSQIAWLDIKASTHGAIMAALRDYFGETFEKMKSAHLKVDSETEDGQFSRLPVVSACAKSRHSDMLQTIAESSGIHFNIESSYG